VKPLLYLTGQCNEIFRFWFFRESSSPKPVVKAFGSFQIFSKVHGDICKSRCTTGINDTSSKFAAGVNYNAGKFVTGINDTGGKFSTNTASVVDTGGKFDTRVKDTSSKTPVANNGNTGTTGCVYVDDTGSKTPVANNGWEHRHNRVSLMYKRVGHMQLSASTRGCGTSGCGTSGCGTTRWV
jgi:hypothetical protein